MLYIHMNADPFLLHYLLYSHIMQHKPTANYSIFILLYLFLPHVTVNLHTCNTYLIILLRTVCVDGYVILKSSNTDNIVVNNGLQSQVFAGYCHKRTKTSFKILILLRTFDELRFSHCSV